MRTAPDDDGRLRRSEAHRHKLRKVKRRTALPFPNVDRYRLLKAATEVFLMIHCGVDLDDFSRVDLDEESRRLNRDGGAGRPRGADARLPRPGRRPATASSSTCCRTSG